MDDCVEAIHSIVNSEKRKAVNNMSLIKLLKKSLKLMRKENNNVTSIIFRINGSC